MSGQTINQSATRIEALQLQSSAYGVTVALAYGRTRVPGNLLWYGGFRAVPHTETQSGKGGGGVKVQNTTYSYRASVMMGLCEGPVMEVPRIWRGKQLFGGGYAPSQLRVARETFTPSAPGGSYTVAHAATLLSAPVCTIETSNRSRGGSHLVAGLDYVEDGGTLTFPSTLAGRNITISYQYANGRQPKTATEQLGLSFLPGRVGQPVWSYLATRVPSQAIPYSGIAAVAGEDYDLGTGAQVENHTFEVLAPLAYSIGTDVPDADPAEFTADVLCNARYGALFPADHLASLQD